jgi:hypothetical protein
VFEAFDAPFAAQQPVNEVEGGWREVGTPSAGASDEVARGLKARGYI